MNAWRAHSLWLRRFYYLAILLVTSVGVFTFILSESTERLFAWTINPPLTAAFLALLSAREPIWVRVRITYAVSLVFTGLTGLATFLHLDKFQFEKLNGWLWVIVYATVPPLLVVLFFVQRRERGDDPPRTVPIARWLMPIVAVQAAIVLVLGLALFLAPSTADSLWPWPLTPLTARTVSAWMLALAAGLAMTLVERDWARVRVATLTYTAAPLLQFVALARFSETLNWSAPGIWLYVGFLAGILLLGIYGLRRSWALGGQTAASPAAAPSP